LQNLTGNHTGRNTVIERYFTQGRRFKWAEPREAEAGTDGAIIDNPLVPHGPMAYDGLDGRLYKRTTANIIADGRLGLTMGTGIPYNWLAYAPGRTTRLSAAGDVLTGPMSGCIIAVWQAGGKRYVGHIGTVGDKDLDDKVKAIFAANMPQNTSGFNPGSGVWNIDAPGIIAQIIPMYKWIQLALVTANNQCYSILMLKTKHPNQWCVGGIKRVQLMDYDDIRDKFLPRERVL